DFPGPALVQRHGVLMDELEPAEAHADERAAFFAILVRQLDARVRQARLGGAQRQLREARGLLELLLGEMRLRVEARTLARDAHRKIGGVEQRDGADAALALAERGERLAGGETARRDHADAGDDDAMHTGRAL